MYSRKPKTILLLLLFFYVGVLFAKTSTLNQFVINASQSEQAVSGYFEFSTSPKYHTFVLKKTDRVVVDFVNTRNLAASLTKQKGGKLIKSVRYANHGSNNFRVVFDVRSGTKINLKKVNGHRIAFELFKQSNTLIKPKKVVARKAPIKSVRTVLIPKKLRDVVVVIDPGHGGKDPGAMGQRRAKEKNVVLAIAKKLKAMVDKQPGMRAMLTRSGDYYIGLRKRLNIARQHDADIFISIHADAYLNKRSHGASVFALSQKGATSEAARWLAAKENYSELGGVDLSELDDDNGMVRSVLIDLSQTATIGASLSLGEIVLKQLDKITDLHHEGVEQARFVVLKSPDIPSILVETGFISNRNEERLLTSSRYQTKLARSILSGLRQYFFAHPPRDSFLAHKSKQYQVVRGDTLSTVAHRFDLSVTAIKKINKLSSNMLYVGQKIILPI